MSPAWAWLSAVTCVAVASPLQPLRAISWDEPQLRDVTPAVTASRVVDVMVNILVRKLGQRLEMDQKQLAALPISGSQPFPADGGEKAIRVKINNAVFNNFGSLRRAKGASYDTSRYLLHGSFSLDRMRVRGDYELGIDAVGEAPAGSASGRAYMMVHKIFVDFTFLTDADGLPVAIKSWRPRTGRKEFLWASGLDGNSYKDVFSATLDNALESLAQRILEKDLYNLVNNNIVNKMELA